MNQPFTSLTALAAPLLRDNIDTDAIIPSREMRSTTKTGLADGMFAGWRYTAVGSREINPDFILNDPRFAAARILLTGANYGCGSSREHAAWAMAEYGFRAVIAESFNPIFRGNCVNNGIVPVELSKDAIAALSASLGDMPSDRPITVDLVACEVRSADGASYVFRIDAESRTMLLEGKDAIGLTLNSRDLIQAKRDADRSARPWIYLAPKAA